MNPQTIYEYISYIISITGETSIAIDPKSLEDMTIFIGDMSLFVATVADIRYNKAIRLEQITTLIQDCKIFNQAKINMIDFIRSVIVSLSIELTDEVDLFLRLQ